MEAETDVELVKRFNCGNHALATVLKTALAMSNNSKERRKAVATADSNAKRS